MSFFCFLVLFIRESGEIWYVITESEKNGINVKMLRCNHKAASKHKHKVLPNTLISTLIMTIHLFQHIEFNLPSNCTVHCTVHISDKWHSVDSRDSSLLNDFTFSFSPSTFHSTHSHSVHSAMCIATRFPLMTGEQQFSSQQSRIHNYISLFFWLVSAINLLFLSLTHLALV